MNPHLFIFIGTTFLLSPVFAEPTLNASTKNLALSVKGLTLDGQTSGQSRVITITNNGNTPATKLSIDYPAWPSGTSVNTTATMCTQGGTLAAGSSCTITITPGATASSGVNNLPCTTGVAPIPGVISLTANNTHAISINVFVLSYGCIYQGGYIYTMTETSSASKSIGGTVTAAKDQAPIYPDGAIWDSNGNGAAGLCSQYSIDTSGNSPCLTGDCYKNWYLPAICEMGPDTDGSGCTPDTQNITDNLPFLIGDPNQNSLMSCKLGINCLAGDYWSSTEFSVNPKDMAWYESFASSGNSFQFNTLKSIPLGVRCSRKLTL